MTALWPSSFKESRARAESLVLQAAVVDLGLREEHLFSPVVLTVPPLGLVESLGHQGHGTKQVSGIEVRFVNPREDLVSTVNRA
jgi:hypothetical protein